MDLFVCSSFEQGGPDEAYRRQQMSREAAAVCRGALAAGGERILVKDGCGTGYNIDPQLLPSEAQLNRGCAQDVYGRMSGIQRGGWDAAAFTGFANRCPGVHTESIEINGLIGSEFLLCAYAAGLENVPVCFVSGDAAVCEQARRLIPSIAIVPVYKREGGSMTCLHPDLVVQRIEEGVCQQLDSGMYRQCQVPLPERFDVRVFYRRPEQAYRAGFYPGAQRLDERTVQFSDGDYYNVMTFFLFAL